ncbi:alpha/beta fold hydrolase [Paraburkholderia pallida]|uniref:Alpha/beta fold hydrolase n=1 Tax=Paraburkholderia pallida TaxID=2547399 RepID=A0A4P7CWV3_9BURK|nr:alpha/beta hydrolase [Paraburkholderia pallida]QBQ98749.1 alpha/beta fold hydrolase [Paraburkholderia pallida]
MTQTTMTVSTEQAELYCERRGKGPLLLMITGALGDAGFFSDVADILATEYTVVTYDRRGNSRSTGDLTAPMTVAQQARDAIAVIRASGEKKALIFGNSGGAVVGLELAARHPEVVDFLIAHEAPAGLLLPEAREWQALAEQVDEATRTQGWEAAERVFTELNNASKEAATLVALEYAERAAGNWKFFFEQEYMPFTLYVPDLARIRGNQVSMVTAAGVGTGDGPAGRAAVVIAEGVGCPMVEVPGHHLGFTDMPVEFAAATRAMLKNRGRG